MCVIILFSVAEWCSRLRAVAKKDGIFDDATLEISELTAVLKLDRDRVEQLIKVLGMCCVSLCGAARA